MPGIVRVPPSMCVPIRLIVLGVALVQIIGGAISAGLAQEPVPVKLKSQKAIAGPRARRVRLHRRFYNTIRRHSIIGYLSPVDFERKIGLALLPVYVTDSRPLISLEN